MTTLFAYRKVPTESTIIQMAMPYSPDMPSDLLCTELCTLDGVTYVAVPDGLELPLQPDEITLTPAVMTPELRDQIKAASPHVALISERTEQRILAKYSVSDEAKFARIGVGVALGVYVFGEGEQDELVAFGAFVEAARQWGRDERAKLGL